MSIYVDKVHIYCDHDSCDNETMIEAEELGSIDFSTCDESVALAISDFAFENNWYIDINSKVWCPIHDKEAPISNPEEQKGSHLWTGEV